MTRLLAALRLVPSTAWILLAVAAAVLTGLAWLYHVARADGAQAVRDQVAAANQAAQTRAAAARETAAGERRIDTDAIHARQRERDRETHASPDRRPDPDQLPHLCGELRRHGVDVSDLAECRGLAR